MNAPTVSNLIFGNLALLLYIETTHKHMPLALPAGWGSDTNLSRRWWGKAFHPRNTYYVLAYLLHLDIRDISCDITVVVQWSLYLIQQLRSACADSDATWTCQPHKVTSWKVNAYLQYPSLSQC